MLAHAASYESVNKVIPDLPMLGSTIPSAIANSIATHTVRVSEFVTLSVIHPSMFNFVSCDSLLCRWNASCVTSCNYAVLRWRHFRAHVIVRTRFVKFGCQVETPMRDTGCETSGARHQTRNTGCETQNVGHWGQNIASRHWVRDPKCHTRKCSSLWLSDGTAQADAQAKFGSVRHLKRLEFRCPVDFLLMSLEIPRSSSQEVRSVIDDARGSPVVCGVPPDAKHAFHNHVAIHCWSVVHYTCLAGHLIIAGDSLFCPSFNDNCRSQNRWRTSCVATPSSHQPWCRIVMCSWFNS